MDTEKEWTVRWDEEWLAGPVQRLIDHLTETHREFRERDLPSIERGMECLLAEPGLASEALRSALPDFRTFRRDFHYHMEEEEAFLFPKILRTEASLRHPEAYPEVFKGSVSAFTEEMAHFPEEEFTALMEALERSLRASAQTVPPPGPAWEALLAEMSGCAAKLKAHARLESGILFRKAAEMERELRKRNA
jgi:iron-sulfur cluster repair protein YtfE (RIC family)